MDYVVRLMTPLCHVFVRNLGWAPNQVPTMGKRWINEWGVPSQMPVSVPNPGRGGCFVSLEYWNPGYYFSCDCRDLYRGLDAQRLSSPHAILLAKENKRIDGMLVCVDAAQ
jgi:hypothetical protein